MRVSPGLRALVSFGIPLLLVAGLARYDLEKILAAGGVEVWVTAMAVCLCFALLVAAERVWKFQFRIEKGNSGLLLITVVGFFVYLWGSYLGSFVLHWVSFPLVYLGLCGYLAGGRATVFLVPSVALFTLIVFPAWASQFAPLVGYVMLATLCGVGLVLARFRVARQAECTECQAYLRQGKKFCLRCGRLNGSVQLPLEATKLAKILVGSVLILLVFTLNVPLLTMGSSGLSLTTYSLTGVKERTPVPSASGWTASQVSLTANESGYVSTYRMSGKGQLNVTVSISPSPYVSSDRALVGMSNPTRNGSVEIFPGASATVVLSEGNQSSEGLLWGTQITYLSEGKIVHDFATVLVSGSAFSYSSGSGGFLTVSSSVGRALTPAGGLPGIVTPVLSSLLPYDGYLLAGLGSCILMGVASVARSMDRRDARKLDGSLELGNSEFELLTSIAGLGARCTGADLLARNGEAGDWPSLDALLNRFLRLGLMEPQVFAREGFPQLLWTCRVA